MAIKEREAERYRANVGLALFDRQGRVFLGRRVGASGPFQWQMPQGGIDAGETPLEAAFRELEEEIGVPEALARLLEETEDWLFYDFPGELHQYARGYRGQRQKWFALRFLGEDKDVRLDLHTPEFSEWRWADLSAAPNVVIPFKRGVYQEVARRFARYAVGD